MAIIKSHAKITLYLPLGPALPAGRRVLVERWDLIKDVPVVQAWLGSGQIEVVERAVKRVGPAPQPVDLTAPSVADILVMAENGTPFAVFRSEASRILGRGLPKRKTDIVSALRDRL